VLKFQLSADHHTSTFFY